MSRPSASGGLVERERELAAIGEAVDAGARGSGGLVVVEGHGGMGKTRLLEAAADLAEAAGSEVLRARGHDLEREFAFGVAMQLLQRRVMRAEAAEREALLEGAAALAAPLLRGELDAAADALQHGLFWLVSNLADRRPLVLWVDDAHLADVPSLRFLLYLAQRVEDLPVTVCLGARPGEAGDGQGLLDRLRAHPAATVLPVGALTVDGVGWLVAEHGFPGADRVFVRACAEATAGNPFYLLELLDVLSAEGAAGTAADTERVARIGPSPVAHAIWLALSRLSPHATAFARGAAVLGDGARVRHVAALSDIDEGTAAAAAAALADAGLLQPAEDVRFVHAVVRAAIYDDLHVSERAVAHAAAARLLAADPEGLVEEAAAHLLAADVVREDWGAEVLAKAGRRAAAAGDHAGATRLYRRLLREPLPPDRRADALVELAHAESAAGDGDAVARLEEALALVDAPGRARVLLTLGRTLHQAGQFSEAAAAYRRALDPPPEDPALVSELHSGWANAALWDPNVGVAAYDEALRTLLDIGEPATPGERIALANLAGAGMLRGEDREAVVDFARRAWGDGELLTQAGPQEAALYSIAPALGWADELDEAMAIYAATAREAQRHGLVVPFATAMYGVGGAHLARGEIPEAIAALESAFDAERYGWGQFITGAYWMLARALIERGDTDAAARLLDLPPEDEERLAATPDFLAIPGARGYLHLARGDAAAAVPEFEQAGRLVASIGVANPAFFPWRPGLIAALVASGEHGRARSLAQEQLELARRWGAPSVVGASLADLARTEPEPAARAAGLRGAAEVLTDAPARLTHAHAVADLGTALLAAGDRAAAAASLRDALDLAERCGATALAATARASLVAAGARPRRARTTGAAALTPSELRVARMAAEGRTNREIAEDLFVTVKAVRFHLGNTYKKLGVTERQELADALAS